ncbi:hypothetical protein RTCIAT899_PB00405 (plasmid) [Rhizobium tropici CIAT 899]|nr:hypothetical protein RTCIAT899_PB00405 [Rhizobium tropici CIAT 899]
MVSLKVDVFQPTAQWRSVRGAADGQNRSQSWAQSGDVLCGRTRQTREFRIKNM